MGTLETRVTQEGRVEGMILSKTGIMLLFTNNQTKDRTGVQIQVRVQDQRHLASNQRSMINVEIRDSCLLIRLMVDESSPDSGCFFSRCKTLTYAITCWSKYTTHFSYESFPVTQFFFNVYFFGFSGFLSMFTTKHLQLYVQ